ncbi:DUF29 domain-containing protein [Thiorhodococcus mannitoliphagus]|uniref:DUF29 domain-containing protein n=1 Tax=Thiorhodococcus mannitoliphagus TaxID=329406 RepID=A0A6P1DTJ8_9GAMM|nr:DUF29 domain-containing protein [Thiorhodococcus mannitoliphagus]NEX19014.1 DUF29 domain-containing protein [Thiorhodococcus mannitoliphagus]
MTDLADLYQTDYAAWAQRNAELLRTHRFDELDIAHLLEELGDMGKSERHEMENRLLILLAHLLKWDYQYQTLSERWREFKGDSWRETIIEQRDRIAKRLRKSPALKSSLDEIQFEAYADARVLASKETRLPLDTFPERCPYTWSQILDDDFYPESRP